MIRKATWSRLDNEREVSTRFTMQGPGLSGMAMLGQN
jgi:hypothetical protein